MNTRKLRSTMSGKLVVNYLQEEILNSVLIKILI